MTRELPESVSRETISKLEAYLALLGKWQGAINLVSPSTIPDAWNRHIVDSAQIVSLIPDTAKTVFDFGSGAGFPGLVIAIMRSDLGVHLIESDQKKCSFLKNVSRETSTPVHVHNVRVESLNLDVVPDVITARALTSLTGLLAYAKPWAEKNPDLVLLFPKGSQADEEIREAQETYKFTLEKFPSKTDLAASILRITNLA